MTHAVKLDMPQANNPPPIDLRPEVIDLEVDFDGTVVWNGTVVPASRRSRATSVPKPARSRSRRSICVPIAAPSTTTVAQVLAAAQRNRMNKIGFVNTAEFRD